MKIPRTVSGVGLAIMSLVLLVLQTSAIPMVLADTQTVSPDLQFREVSITSDNEFVVLQNVGTAPAELGNYWLGYSGNEAAMAAPTQNLAKQTLQPGEAIILTKSTAALCGASKFDSLAFTLGNTSGVLSLWRLQDSSGQAMFSLLSSLAWGKAKSTNATYLNMTDENAVKQYKKDADVVWYQQPGVLNQAWRAGFLSNCSFIPVINSTTPDAIQTVNWQPNDDSPPFSVAPAVVLGSGTTGPSIPAVDIGLKAPQLSEILPNPASPKTDAEDEFIELYNPNDTAFDLTGFKLKIGSTTSAATHSYTFPAATIMSAKSFKVFYSESTNLSLNNSGGQVWLIDPLGSIIGQSDVYNTAKDGLVWVNAGGKWQWSAIATPGDSNKVSPIINYGNNSKSSTVKGTSQGTVKGASTSSNKVASSINNSRLVDDARAPIHAWVLAAVVMVALLYGAYEYRVDLANRLYQFRRYRTNRRSDRS